jgi:UDP-glucose 4-epimerase
MEVVCRSFASSFGMKISVVRPFSVYGPWLEKQLIWDLCSKLFTGNRLVELGGTGRESRDWLNVRDLARLLVLVANEGLSEGRAEFTNAGTGCPTTVRDFANMVIDAWQDDVSLRFSGVSRKGDPECLVADISRAKQLGFVPEITLDHGIREYVAWFKRRVHSARCE